MPERLPHFSIIVPTYARPVQLNVCLQALARLDYPRDQFEVIIVDDGGRMPPEVVAPFQHWINLKLLVQENAGPAAARNTGAAHAGGDFLAFTDDDCAPDSTWLKALATQFQLVPDHAIGGRTVNALPDNLYSAASQMLVDYLYSYYNAVPSQAVFFTSNNFALPRELFHSIGGFNEEFPRAAGEDREFCDRWLHHGYRMTYTPEAVVFHAHPLTLRSFWRQHFNYGRSALRYHQARAQRRVGRIKVEPLRFYLDLLRYPLSSKQHGRGMLLSLLFVISQIANTAGFFHERIQDIFHDYYK